MAVVGENLLKHTYWTDEYVQSIKSADTANRFYGDWAKSLTGNILIKKVEETNLYRIQSLVNNSKGYGIVQDVRNLKANTDYTFSAEVGDSFFIGFSMGSNMWPSKPEGFVVEEGFAKYTFNTGSGTTLRIFIYANKGLGYVSYMNFLKLEEGTEATDWVPAPEEYESVFGGVVT